MPKRPVPSLSTLFRKGTPICAGDGRALGPRAFLRLRTGILSGWCYKPPSQQTRSFSSHNRTIRAPQLCERDSADRLVTPLRILLLGLGAFCQAGRIQRLMSDTSTQACLNSHGAVSERRLEDVAGGQSAPSSKRMAVLVGALLKGGRALHRCQLWAVCIIRHQNASFPGFCACFLLRL